MLRRNWLALARKIIGPDDLDLTVNGLERYVAQANLAMYGKGVLIGTTYPVPFALTPSASALTGTVSNGIAYDPYGLQIRVTDGLGAFTISTPDTAQSRWDLLVIEYQTVGKYLIPQPSAPTQQVYENLDDYYKISVIPGVVGAGAYPAKTDNYQIILAGIQVPANAASASACYFDLSVRESASPLRAFLPSFMQETPTGNVDGSNQSFTLSQTPFSASSTVISVDGLPLKSSEWTLSGQTVTLAAAPTIAQDVQAFYVVNGGNSVNPITAVQETPTGNVDGMNQTFTLSQQPIDQKSVQVYVDGALEKTANWALSMNPAASSIVFNAGSVPVPGQEVYVVYWRNAAPSYVPQAQASSGSGSAARFQVDYPQLAGTDISNGYVTLSQLPANPSCVTLDIIGGEAQTYQSDFTVNGKQLTWSQGLAQVLTAGDQFRVMYTY